MRIKTHIAVSVDGFITSRDGLPSILSMPDFDPGRTHGYPEFIASCSAVVMGRTTFEPALDAPRWPWPGLDVFVLTTRPLPAWTPPHVVAAARPADLLGLMRDAKLPGDVHLVGGQRTIQAFRDLNALDSLGIVIVPVLLGDGVRLTALGSDTLRLRLDSTRAFPDGSVEHVYAPAERIR